MLFICHSRMHPGLQISILNCTTNWFLKAGFHICCWLLYLLSSCAANDDGSLPPPIASSAPPPLPLGGAPGSTDSDDWLGATFSGDSLCSANFAWWRNLGVMMITGRR